ncbi:MAG TPA: N-acetylneuraminate synthase [Clostridia bacterium]
MLSLLGRDRVFIIAEAGVNHNGSLETALKMVDAAAEAGADAVKFQTFLSEKLVTKAASMAVYQKENTGKNQTQFEMLKSLELDFKSHKKLFEYCTQKRIMFLSTPFDFESVDLLEKLGVKAYKLSSGDLNNKPFIDYVASKNKPMILSTGMAEMDEIGEALSWVGQHRINDIFLLHCTTDYPAKLNEVNLRAIVSMEKAFGLPVGYSDHTEGLEVSIAAATLGAAIIEKHFTLDRNMEGPDHKASLEPHSLKQMIDSIRNIELALGDGIKRITPGESAVINNARKSVTAACTIEEGEVIEFRHLEIKRPGTGIPPKYMEQLIGKKVNKKINEDQTIGWDDIE